MNVLTFNELKEIPKWRRKLGEVDLIRLPPTSKSTLIRPRRAVHGDFARGAGFFPSGFFSFISTLSGGKGIGSALKKAELHFGGKTFD